MSTMEEVAKVAGVSKSTVSNVFSKKRPISKEVRERVLAVAKQLNYKPNYWARSLAVKETRIIGLNMQAEKVKFSQFHLSLLNGVLNECFNQGYRLLVNTLSENFRTPVEFQASDPVDGEILLDPSIDDKRIADGIIQGHHLVVIGKPPSRYEDKITYVDNNNIGAAEQVTAQLIELGHKNILFLNAPVIRTVSNDREMGYKKAFQSVGFKVDPKMIVNKDEQSTSVEYGYAQAKRMLGANSNISAIITDNDKIALGVYKAAEELGYSIPEHLSVISFSDDTVYAAEFSPPLTSVRLNGEMLGTEAAKLLIEQLKLKQSLVKRVVVPTEFVKRGSCMRRK